MSLCANYPYFSSKVSSLKANLALVSSVLCMLITVSIFVSLLLSLTLDTGTTSTYMCCFGFFDSQQWSRHKTKFEIVSWERDAWKFKININSGARWWVASSPLRQVTSIELSSDSATLDVTLAIISRWWHVVCTSPRVERHFHRLLSVFGSRHVIISSLMYRFLHRTAVVWTSKKHVFGSIEEN